MDLNLIADARGTSLIELFYMRISYKRNN